MLISYSSVNNSQYCRIFWNVGYGIEVHEHTSNGRFEADAPGWAAVNVLPHLATLIRNSSVLLGLPMAADEAEQKQYKNY